MFTNMSDKVDIEATVESGGPTGQCGVIRWGIAWGLRSFVDKSLIEKMRIGKEKSIREIFAYAILMCNVYLFNILP